MDRRSCRLAVIDKDSKECIGQIAYFLVDNKNNFAKIEYCIGPAFRVKDLQQKQQKQGTRQMLSFKDINTRIFREKE